jgi:hypothetical protein
VLARLAPLLALVALGGSAATAAGDDGAPVPAAARAELPSGPLAPRPAAEELDPDLRLFAPRHLELRPAELRELPTRLTERSWTLAISESLAANAVIWSAARGSGQAWTRLTLSSAESNVDGPWVFDSSHFTVNQFGHPYQGHLAFAAARSSGFGFWGAAAFPLVSSTLWELFAETNAPSINDEINTPVGGVFVGEVLFRLSRMVLAGGGLRPSGARQAAAWLVSPTTGTAQLVSGNRYRTRPEEPIPLAMESRLGASFGGNADSEGAHSHTGGLVSGTIQVTHGLPVGDWRPRNPFDHFDFLASVNATRNPWVVLQVRGLLRARELGSPRSRGFWGLWGLYDLTTLKTFRASASALGFGATGQWVTPHGLALQGTAIAAAGYGAAGTKDRTPSTPDYHYGLGGMAILDGRLIAADRGAVRLGFRQYYVGGLVSPDTRGQELISYATFGATLRLFGHHAVGLDLTRSGRAGSFPGRDDTNETFTQAIAYYAHLSDKTMGSGLQVVERED